MAGVPVPRRASSWRRALRIVLAAVVIAVGLSAGSAMRPLPVAAVCPAFATCGTIDYTVNGPGQGGVHSNDYAGCDTLDGLPHSCSERVPVGDSLTITMAVQGPTCGSGWSFSLICGTVGTEKTTSVVLVVPAGTTTITVNFAYVDQIVVYATKSGTGTGTVTVYGYPNLNCGSQCAANLPGGIQLTFYATADSGSVFDYWTTGCTGDTNPKCPVTPTDGMTLSARFDRLATATPKPTPAGSPKPTSAPTPAPAPKGTPSTSAQSSATLPTAGTGSESPQASALPTSPQGATSGAVDTAAPPIQSAAPGSGSATTGGASTVPIVLVVLLLLVVALGGGAMLRRRGRL